MPTIIRKSPSSMIETRRETYHSITWHVRASTWSPPTDVYETEEHMVLRMEVAGLREEDVVVAVEDNVLTISGNRSDSGERRAYHQMEIRFGKFEITVHIPMPVQIESASAQYKDGLLIVRLPKASPNSLKVE